jgi:hypothetical protein
MRASTKRLIDAITEEIGDKTPTTMQDHFMGLAQRDWYHDFVGEPTFPMISLVRDARACGLPGVAEKCISGEFDSDENEQEILTPRE